MSPEEREVRLRASVGEVMDRTRENVSISAPEMLDRRWRMAKDDMLESVLRVLEEDR